jgi:phage tail sheath protein FI
MPAALTYPGVYVQEKPSGVRTITPVSTSIALFIGQSMNGPIGVPTLCLNYSDFVRAFGDDSAAGDLPRQVKLFFLNNGAQCYVMRIADNASSSAVTLKSEGAAPANVLDVKAANEGGLGDSIRIVVDYNTALPEATFNMTVFAWKTDSSGVKTPTGVEVWRNLSMNPLSSVYAPAFVTQNSKLITLTPAGGVLPVAGTGSSQSGRPITFTNDAAFVALLATLVGNAAGVTTNRFGLSVGGSQFVKIDLSAVAIAGAPSAAAAAGLIQAAVRTALANAPGVGGATAGTVNVAFVNGPPSTGAAGAPGTRLLQIKAASIDVLVQPWLTHDAAKTLMLGTAQGGLEVGAFAASRPAATGFTLDVKDGSNVVTIAGWTPNAAATNLVINVDNALPSVNVPLPALATGANALFFTDSSGGTDGVREKLGLVAKAVNDYRTSQVGFPWRAEVWGQRLALINTNTDDNFIPGTFTPAFVTAPTLVADVANLFVKNVPYLSLGANGAGSFQTAGAPGSDGTKPLPSDYDAAYPIIDKEVDIFNLMILPQTSPVQDITKLYGNASVFCQQRRALLLMDAPVWPDVQTAAAGVPALRIGLVKDYSALYFPRLIINENGLQTAVGPTGAIAGLMARIDTSRGVWKAPAGAEADLRGIVGLEQRFSDAENGVLNPRAINTLRVFPDGVVCWGARTMDGDDNSQSEYKYVPIRRLALFIEESLYRGLKWVVFEPNDEPLWAQIRLNVGAFMNSLFRQGAFQGAKATDAYFVKCDAETTTQDDRNRGIVNIWVGFAPLKPAEFVVLYLQQIAGQIQV